ncbi:TlpA family protein disulfide reductase [Phytoactinopolyspora mesophila]|uniref:Thioredoxin n=1 Tax=Phytoactinopolyspora mesophila TaxID=2650750 RepID=A0A7K3M522_9ACTN|nr:thioredoxin family protein [Phytoactinopolyspora mesophila]NDL58411.1 thioredoxin [Phytoactinopolyspora mesophila]
MTGLVVVVAVLALATAFGLWRRRSDGTMRAVPEVSDAEPDLSEQLGGDLGDRATLVQFSTAFCQPCRAVRGTLSHVAGTERGVEHIEVDAESNLDLVRRLGIARTPTTLVLDGAGRVVGRATGVPSLDDVRASLPPA